MVVSGLIKIKYLTAEVHCVLSYVLGSIPSHLSVVFKSGERKHYSKYTELQECFVLTDSVTV